MLVVVVKTLIMSDIFLTACLKVCTNTQGPFASRQSRLTRQPRKLKNWFARLMTYASEFIRVSR